VLTAKSLRCPSAVAAVAAHLKDSDGSFGPVDGKTGRAFLICGKDSNMVAEVVRVAQTYRLVKPGASVKIVVRQNATVDALTGRAAKDVPKLGCPPVSHLHRAVTTFRQGNQVKALAASRAATELIVFGKEGFSDAELEAAGLALERWKWLAVSCLLRANQIQVTGCLRDHQTLFGSVLDDEIGKFGLPATLSFTPGKLKPKKNKHWDQASTDYLPLYGDSDANRCDAPVRTVHGVKGETHDLTLVVCPDPANKKTCPSQVWWSSDEKCREEKRIAYVAATRSRDTLVFWVSEGCYQRLKAARPEFVQSFECMTVDEVVAALATAESPKVAAQL